MSEIGNTLREARVRKGLTIRDVEDATKIRTKYLQALEQEDFEVLPGPTYVKAFLRTYASYLKLDPDALLEEYRRAQGLYREEIDDAHIDPGGRSRSRTIAERRRRKTRRTQRGFALVGVLAVVAVVLLAWLGSGWGRQDAATLSPGSLASTEVTTGVTDVEETSTTVEVGNSTTTVSVVVTSGENVKLVLAITEGSCWLVVHEDSEAGAELYAGTLSAGGQKSFDSSKRYWMRVGNPAVLAVTVNGVPIELDDTAGAFVVTETGVELAE